MRGNRPLRHEAEVTSSGSARDKLYSLAMRPFLLASLVLLGTTRANAAAEEYRRILYVAGGGNQQDVALERALNAGADGLPYLVVVTRDGEALPERVVKRFAPE